MGPLEEYGGGTTWLPASPELAREEGRHFLRTNEKFRQLIRTARINPSENTLEAVCECKDATGKSATPMQEYLFFRASGDEKLIKTAVGSVLHTTEQNWKLATKIDPDDPSPEGFPEGLRDMLVTKLMEEEEEDVDLSTNALEVNMNDLEMLSELPADALTFLVCNEHKLSVEGLYISLMTSSEIIDHEFEQAERERRRERIVTVSLATAGAFIASSLAYAIAQRRRK